MGIISWLSGMKPKSEYSTIRSVSKNKRYRYQLVISRAGVQSIRNGLTPKEAKETIQRYRKSARFNREKIHIEIRRKNA